MNTRLKEYVVVLLDRKDVLVLPMLLHAFENFVLGPIFLPSIGL